MIKVWDIEQKKHRMLHPIDAREQFVANLILLKKPGEKDEPESPQIDESKKTTDKKKAVKKPLGKKPISPKLEESTDAVSKKRARSTAKE